MHADSGPIPRQRERERKREGGVKSDREGRREKQTEFIDNELALSRRKCQIHNEAALPVHFVDIAALASLCLGSVHSG